MSEAIEKFWPSPDNWPSDSGFQMEARSAVAFKIMTHFAMIGGAPGGEDSQGRAFLRLQTPDELVARSFRIADLFVDEALKRGEFRAMPERRRRAPSES
jgi:hypothetical protein